MTPPTTSTLTPSRLVGLLSDLSVSMAHRTDAVDGLGALTATAVAEIAGVDFASISRHRANHFQTLGPTSPDAAAADQLQYDLGSGPCVDAVVEQTSFRTGDVRTDSRWPVYGPRSFAEYGVLSMLSVRLVLDGDNLRGSLNLYSRSVDAFGDDADTVATLLATYGAEVLARLTARENAANLTVALTNARRIGIAVGVVMSTQKVTADEAFELLRTTSQHTNRKLTDVVDDVAASGSLSPDR